jgi:hypothetical protein
MDHQRVEYSHVPVTLAATPYRGGGWRQERAQAPRRMVGDTWQLAILAADFVPLENPMSDPRLDEILRFLNEEQIRATYGAVAAVLGVIPQSIGARLGSRRAAASWIVNSQSGLPTGYQAGEIHPALFSKNSIIKSGDELQRRMATWRKRPRSG